MSVKEIVEKAKKMPARERARLIRALKALSKNGARGRSGAAKASRPSVQRRTALRRRWKPLTREQAEAEWRRFQSFQKDLPKDRSRYTDVSSNKYKHLGDAIYEYKFGDK